MPLRPEPSSIMDLIEDLLRRVSTLERSPQAGSTAISQGATTVVDPATGNVIVRIGKLSDGSYGVEIRKADGSYGKVTVT